MYSRDELAHDFRRLGVAAGDTVMMHASVRAVGAIAGGPDQIHLALKDALTGEGTLMMYASCPQHTDEVGQPEGGRGTGSSGKTACFRCFNRAAAAREWHFG